MKLFNIIFMIITFCSISLGLEYILALERCDNSPPGNYTIHGLWPQFNSTSWPQYCNESAEFNYDALSPLMNQIDMLWQTCAEFNHTEKWFLKHEWIKHGTCTPFTEVQYFSTVLALYQLLPWNTTCNPNEYQCLLEINGILSI